MLYEQVDLKTLSQKEFSEFIYRAFELVMKPFTLIVEIFLTTIKQKSTMISSYISIKKEIRNKIGTFYPHVYCMLLK